MCLCNTRIRKYYARKRKARDRERTGLLFAPWILFQAEGAVYLNSRALRVRLQIADYGTGSISAAYTQM